MSQCIIVILFLGFVNLACAGPTGRIVGGKDAPDGKYPYQAYLTNYGALQCGASILNKRWLLTAAHCVQDLNVSIASVIVGTNDQEAGGTVYLIDFYIGHPDYSVPIPSVAPINDIALISVTEDIQFNEKVQPVTLPLNKAETYEGSVATLTGWGRLGYSVLKHRYLQNINLTIYNQEKCGQSWYGLYKNKIIDSQICTFTKEGEGACNGDSGGPLVIGKIQVGIVSFGEPCAIGYPDVFTRVSSYLNWINDNINNIDNRVI